MTADPFSQMERRLLDTVRRMQQDGLERQKQISALEQTVTAQSDRIVALEEMMQQTAAILGRSFLPGASN